MTALAAALRRAARPPLDGWTVAAVAVAALVAVPLATIVYRAVDPADDTLRHLAATVLPVYVSNTLWLMLGVGAGTIVIGASTAWLVTMYRFPGRRILSWALLLPLAVPSYVLAFVITDQLEYAGPVQGALREAFGWTSARDYRFPEIRSLGGAAVVLSLVLYPYVYLLARAAFTEQCFCLFEASRTLGRGPARSFLRVALPMARPGIAVGTALALMETLNEFGTVEFFAVPTFTAGIFDVWLNMDSPAGASQLAVALVVFTLALLAIERRARHRGRVHATTTRVRGLPDYPLSRPAAAVAFAWCALPVLLGFVLPAGVLAGYAIEFHEAALAREYLALAGNSLQLAVAAAVVTTALGLVLAYGVRLSRRPGMRASRRPPPSATRYRERSSRSASSIRSARSTMRWTRSSGISSACRPAFSSAGPSPDSCSATPPGSCRSPTGLSTPASSESPRASKGLHAPSARGPGRPCDAFTFPWSGRACSSRPCSSSSTP